MNRTLLVIATIASTFFCTQSLFCAQSLAKPNIILIMADDLGYGEVGCFGQKIIRTPSIDRLAKEGMRFTDFYCGSPVCAPSRCVLMTGLHGGHAFIRDNREHKPEGQLPIPDETVTVAELLKQQGYATGAMGKWGLGYPSSPGDPNKQGFDLFYGFNCQRHAHNHYPRYLWRNDQRETLEGNTRSLTGKQHSQDLFIREALSFIRKNQEQPFFLYLPFAIPHLSIQANEELVTEYRKTVQEEDYEHKGYLKHPYPRAGYAAMVTQMDRGIGEIMSLLSELKIDNNTLVIFTSDNGPTFNRLGGSDSTFFESAGPFRGLKGSVLEGGIRVPTIFHWPGKIKRSTTNDHVAAFEDILPTLCEFAGAKTPDNIDGISLAATLTGKEQEKRDFLLWNFAGYGGQQAVRMGKWKAVREGLKKNPDASIQLYDVVQDVSESMDVSAEHPDVVEKVATILKENVTPSIEFPLP